MTLSEWLSLFGNFLVLSLLSIGGAIAVAPEVRRLMVGQLGLLTDAQFSASLAIAQAAPGPNVLYVAVVGYQAAGWAGATAALFGLLLPSSALAIAASRWEHARREWRAVTAFKSGTAPLAVALLLSTGWVLTVRTPGWTHLPLTVASALLVWRTRIHLLWLMAAGAVLGALGWV